MEKSVIFDIDGTIADITHRRHFVMNRPKDWKAFNAAMAEDLPNEPIVETLKTFHRDGWFIILCSGRQSEYRDVTVKWLADWGIPFHRLYMRAKKDSRVDYIVKKELLDQIRKDGYDPKLAFDDRQQVVDMWRDNGVVCCQVAPGDF